MCKAPLLDQRLYNINHGVALRRLLGVPSLACAAVRLETLNPIFLRCFSNHSPRKVPALKNSCFG